MPTIGMNVYAERAEHRELRPGAIKLLIERHREHIGNPTYALIHSKNHKLAGVIEAEGITVRYLNGVLANELWLGDELPGQCFTEPDLYGRKRSGGNVPSDSARTSAQDDRRATKQAEDVAQYAFNYDAPEEMPVLTGAQQSAPEIEGASKIGRGRPKVHDEDERISQLAAEGLSGRAIARELGLPEATVRRRLKVMQN